MTGTELDPDSVGVHIADLQAGIFHRQRSGTDTQLDVAGHDLDELLFVQVLERVKVVDFRSELGGEGTAGDRAQWSNASHPLDQIVPEGILSDADGGNDPHAANHHPRDG